MRKLILRIIGPIIQRIAKYYFAKPRPFRFDQIKGLVLPGVFYPQLTLSTKILLQYLKEKDLNGKHFLELGCGAGFISVLAAKKGAEVWALDINPKAIENTRINAEKNQVKMHLIQSDLFEKLEEKAFDWIVINPPYYPRTPKNLEEQAWYCGENFEYFEKLFKGLARYIYSTSKVIMILSEDCEIEQIKNMAKRANISFEQVYQKRKWGEDNFIFSLKSI